MNSENVGAVRTGWQAAVVTLIVVAVQRITGWEIDAEDPVIAFLLVPAVGFVLAVFYRLFRFLGDRWPVLGSILFGINRQPIYPTPPPQPEIVTPPVVPEDPNP